MYQQALEIASGNQSIRYQYAVTLAKSGQNDAALGQFTQAVGAAAAHYNLGLILHEQGDLTAAEAQFVAALVKNPKLDQAQGWLDDTRREMDRRQGSRVATASHQRPAFGDDTPPVISALPRESRRDDRPVAAPTTTHAAQRPNVPVGGHSGIASTPPANAATSASSFAAPAGPSGQPPAPPPGLTPPNVNSGPINSRGVPAEPGAERRSPRPPCGR